MSPTKKFLLERPTLISTAILYIIIIFIIIVIILSSYATVNISVNGKGSIDIKEGSRSVYIKSNAIQEFIFIQEGDNVVKNQPLSILNINNKQEKILSPIAGKVILSQSWNENVPISYKSPVYTIIPNSKNLIANIEVSSSEMKNLILGQVVRLKIDAYPYRNFGIWEANIDYISTTTKINKEGKYVYEIRASLNKTQLEQKSPKLILGQSFKAQIVISRQSVLSYFLSFIF